MNMRIMTKSTPSLYYVPYKYICTQTMIMIKVESLNNDSNDSLMTVTDDTK